MKKADIEAMYADGMTTEDIIKMVKEVEAEQEKKKLEAAEAAKKQEKVRVARERAVRALVDYVTIVTGEIVDPKDAAKIEENFKELEHLTETVTRLFPKTREQSKREAPVLDLNLDKSDLDYAEMLIHKYFD